MNIYPVILCGGDGKRLWPLSRKNLPKQFVPILNGNSLLDLTLQRIKNISFLKKPIIVTNVNHNFFVKQSLDRNNLKGRLILEPQGRDTTTAIYLAAKILNKNDVLLIMPSDHHIENNDEFSNLILNSSKLTKNNHWITFGTKPKNPSTSYGYIKIKKENKISDFFDVDYFVEKPPQKKAEKIYADSQYYWNLGIFMSNAYNILSSIKIHAPEIAKLCNKAYENKNENKDKSELTFLKQDFEKIPKISIDYSVLEKTRQIKVGLLKSSWNDLGSWDILSETFENKNSHNSISVLGGNNHFYSSKRVLATIGLKDLIVVDTSDATLIMKKGFSENVKEIVKKLEITNPNIINDNNFEIRPWGRFEILLEEKFYKVKKLSIYPGKRISLQYHKKRSENWVVVSGKASVYLDGKIIELIKSQSIHIPVRSHHYIENKTKEELTIIETQTGEYFGEDDIIRLDDPYNR